MGTGKKEANRKIRQGKVGDGMANVKTKGENFYRFVSLHRISRGVLTKPKLGEESQDPEYVQGRKGPT
jgi:nuclear GTP-binding protein